MYGQEKTRLFHHNVHSKPIHTNRYLLPQELNGILRTMVYTGLAYWQKNQMKMNKWLNRQKHCSKTVSLRVANSIPQRTKLILSYSLHKTISKTLKKYNIKITLNIQQKKGNIVGSPKQHIPNENPACMKYLARFVIYYTWTTQTKGLKKADVCTPVSKEMRQHISRSSTQHSTDTGHSVIFEGVRITITVIQSKKL